MATATVREVQKERTAICGRILRALPQWFGIPSAIEDYESTARQLPMFAAFVEDRAVGFVSVKDHGEFASEIYVMGVRDWGGDWSVLLRNGPLS